MAQLYVVMRDPRMCTSPPWIVGVFSNLEEAEEFVHDKIQGGEFPSGSLLMETLTDDVLVSIEVSIEDEEEEQEEEEEEEEEDEEEEEEERESKKMKL